MNNIIIMTEERKKQLLAILSQKYPEHFDEALGDEESNE